MNLLTDSVTVGGREVPTVAIGAGMAAVGALVVVLTRRNAPTAASTSQAEQTPGLSTETVTPDRLADELATFGTSFQQKQDAGLSGLASEFQALLGQNQADVAGQLLSVRGQLSGQFTGLEGRVSALDNQADMTEQALDNLTGRVTQVEAQTAKVGLVVTAVRRLGLVLSKTLMVIGQAHINDPAIVAKTDAYDNDVVNALRPIGGGLA